MALKPSSQVQILMHHHRLLSHLSQRRELSDRRIPQAVAAVVGDPETLCMLCLMNYAVDAAADRRGWTEWKDTLLWELYEQVHDELLGRNIATERQKARLKSIRNRVLELLEAGPHPETADSAFSPERAEEWLDQHFALLPRRYPLDLNPELLATQILLAKRSLLTGAAVDVMTLAPEEYTRILICCPDFPGLFACVTGTLAAMNVNIIGAHLETRSDGIVVDVLWVSTPAGAVISDSNSLRHIANKVESVLKSGTPFHDLFTRTGEPSMAPPLRPPQIRLSNEISGSQTVLEIIADDRLAVAYIISSCLTSLGLTIHSAKLSTEKAMVYDVFYLTDVTGEKLPQNRWSEVTAALHDVLKGTP